jgi:two-component system phosphate regulon response regulator PhoB
MQTLLIIEDDLAILELISYNLKQEKFQVLKASSGEEGLKLATHKKVDLIILDIMLPGINGLEVCKKLKADNRTLNIPVIMLTARAEEVDRIVGFELGADDYITKPFSPRELILRIKAVLKRGEKTSTCEKALKFKDMTVDQSKHAVCIGTKEIKLTLIEFKLLHYLLKNAGKVISRDTILNNVWGYSADVFSRTVDTHMTRLREKLGAYSKHIKAVRGVGYMWGDK